MFNCLKARLQPVREVYLTAQTGGFDVPDGALASLDAALNRLAGCQRRIAHGADAREQWDRFKAWCDATRVHIAQLEDSPWQRGRALGLRAVDDAIWACELWPGWEGA